MLLCNIPSVIELTHRLAQERPQEMVISTTRTPETLAPPIAQYHDSLPTLYGHWRVGNPELYICNSVPPFPKR